MTNSYACAVRFALGGLLISGCGELVIGSYGEGQEGTSVTGVGGSSTSGGVAGVSGSGGTSGVAGVSGSGGTSGVAGVSGSGGTSGTGGAGGTGGSTEQDRSCRGLESQCLGHLYGCCAAWPVGSDDFVLGVPGDSFSAQARVSRFFADVLEVTVGRFERFVEAYDEWIAQGNPRAGAGQHPYVAGSGWNPNWRLPVSSAELEKLVVCPNSTYARRESESDLPMNCVNWFEAFAFCIWDDKRLLTEAEWELAAEAGHRDWRYPWGNDPEPTHEHAVYGCLGKTDANGLASCSIEDVPPVGSRLLGVSYHGLWDLGGSMAEWVFDGEGVYADPCSDCANTTDSLWRMFRGGNWVSPASALEPESRTTMDPMTHTYTVGFRCARSTY